MSRAVLANGGAFVLRPGVITPDWALVADPVACDALGTSMAVVGRAEKWSGLSATEDLVWQVVLRGFSLRPSAGHGTNGCRGGSGRGGRDLDPARAAPAGPPGAQ